MHKFGLLGLLVAPRFFPSTSVGWRGMKWLAVILLLVLVGCRGQLEHERAMDQRELEARCVGLD